MQTNRHWPWLLWLWFFMVLGCATPCPPRTPLYGDRPGACRAFLESLDQTVKADGVKDDASFSVPCFPYLRCNRFLSALKMNLKNLDQRAYWLKWMQQLDLEGRQREINNLSDQAILSLCLNGSQEPDRRRLYGEAVACSDQLFTQESTRSGFYGSLYPHVSVPDEYSSFMRAAGLYPLASVPVTIVTAKVRRKIRSWFDLKTEDLKITGELTAYAPHDEIFLGDREIENIIDEASRNPLGVPRLNATQEQKLVAHFAPIVIQDLAAAYDEFGKVRWEGDSLAIEPGNPTVYYYISHAFLKGEPILQLNYVIWYSARDGNNSPWMERGPLDGLTFRISLDRRGKIFMVDVANSCGCYHFFSPKKERVLRVISKRFALDPFVPQWLPEVPPEKRLAIRVNSGWHQVQRLLAAASQADGAGYMLIPYQALEALPRDDDHSESMFDSEGIAKGSERIEPFILFPMGIPSVGSMRQRGSHAVELSGRAHFDDPCLFDRNFIFK
jgi:hypothetical protein